MYQVGAAAADPPTGASRIGGLDLFSRPPAGDNAGGGSRTPEEGTMTRIAVAVFGLVVTAAVGQEPLGVDAIKDRLKKHEAELTRVRTAMLKDVEDELKRLDDAIKAAEKAADDARTDRDARQKAQATVSKLRTDRTRVQSLRYDIDRMVNLAGPPPPLPVPAEKRLGILALSVTPALTAQLKLDKGKGMLVDRVEVKSPAESAGMKPNDVVVQIDGKAVPGDLVGFRKFLDAIKPEAEVEVVVVREGKTETLTGLRMPPEVAR